MLINIHSHKIDLSNIDKNILNLVDGIDSFGRHPWKIAVTEEYDSLDIECRNRINEVVFIGETGLDRAYNFENLMLQIESFKNHIKLSNELKLPLVLHIVRSYDLLLAILKKEKTQKMIIHDFRANEFILKSLLNYPIYFSFGSSLLISKKQANLLVNTPLERIFLETDDANIEISKVYEKAGEILKMSPKELEIKLMQNALNFFDDFNHHGAANIIKNLKSVIADEVFYFLN